MYFAEDFERATSEGAQLIRRFPESSELRAWYILSMGRPVLGGREHAVEAARAMTTTHPSDPWGWLALAGALSQAPISDEALVASEKALTMMPHHPDFLWMRAWTLLVSVDRAGEVPPFVDAHLNDAKNQAELLVVKAQALEFLGTQVRHDDGKIAAAYAILDETRRIEPTNFHAHYLPGLYLYRSGEPEKGLELVKQAMALAPDSTMAHREYWRAFNALEPSRQSSERAAVLADLGSLEAKSSLHPWALTQIADQYGALGLRDKQVELEERILKEYPEGQVARLVLHNRLKRLADAIDLYGIHKRQEARKPVGPLLGESEMESIDVRLKRELSSSRQRTIRQWVEISCSRSCAAWRLIHGAI